MPTELGLDRSEARNVFLSRIYHFKVKKKGLSIYLLAFFLPLYSLSFQLLVEIAWYKIMPVFLVALVLIRGHIIVPRGDTGKLIFLLFAYLIFITTIIYINNFSDGVFEEAVRNGQSPTRAYNHMLIQLVTLLFGLSQIFYFRALIKNKFDVDSFINGYIDGTIFSVGFGFVEYVFFKFNLLTSINYYDYALGLFRISGLSGEPKQFAAFCLLALFIVIVNKVTGNAIYIVHSKRKIFILLMGIVFSFSTSAWAGLIIGLIVILAIQIRKVRFEYILTAVSITVLFIALSLFGRIGEIIHARFIDRFTSLEDMFVYIPKDALAYYLLKSDGVIALFGTGAGGFHYKVMNIQFLAGVPEIITNAGIIQVVYSQEVTASMGPSSFLASFIVGYGLLGFSLLISMIAWILKIMSKSPYGKFLFILSIVILFSNVVSDLFTLIYFSIVGVIYGYCVSNNTTQFIRDKNR